MNNKGIFFTISAIALIIVMIITYGSYSDYTETEKMNALESRIDTVNFFIKDVEKDLDKGAFIAGFRTVLSFNEYITTNGSFLDNVEERFKESFINGTIHNQPLTLMYNSTFTDWGQRISQQAKRVGILFNFTLNDVKLTQSSPWAIDINLNLSLYIRDSSNISSWKRDRLLTTRINILGFEDPLYVINSKGKITNLIERSNTSQFVVNNNPDHLIYYANNSLYTTRNGSPSFLMRFEGNLGNSSNGIESLVNIEELQNQGLVIEDRSIVDYIYFGTATTTNERINQTPTWFKLDTDHIDFYDVENITCLPAQCTMP